MLKAFIREIPFAIALLLIAAAVAFLALVVPIAGNKALIVRSGSMQPTIGVGDLITVKPKSTYKVGDVIAFKDTIKSSVVVTHRIIGKEEQGGKIYFQTKGDANKNTDFNLVPVENIIGRANTAIPGIGRIIAFTKTNIGFSLVVIFPALLVIVFELNNIFKEVRKQKRESPLRVVSKAEEKMESPLMFPIIGILDPPKLSRNGLGLRFQDLRVVLPILVSLTFVYSTFAFFSDTETSTGNLFQAAETFGPPIAQTLVMNEILPVSSCNSGQTNGQFVELWNGSGSTVNLQQFSLSDGTNTIAIANSNTSLPNAAFAILVKSEGVINQCLGGNVNSAVTVNLGGNINLNTGILKLIDTDGTTVLDRVEFGSSNGGVLQTIPNQSIERNLLGLDSALGDTFAVADFGKQCPVTPGTWSAPNGDCSVVINEIMWMGNSIPNTEDEWIELKNTTGSSINLAGWVIRGATTGSGSLTIVSGTIPANGFFLISNFTETNANSRLNVTPDLVTTSIQLDNTNALYTLVNNLGHIVDVADDGSGAPLAGSNGTPKASMERNSTSGDGTLVGNWHTATTTVNFDVGATEKGTPKAANSL